MESIYFFSEEIDFKLKNQTKIRSWLRKAVQEHTKKVSCINYIFTSDNHLLAINRKYLKHNTYTDIITFNQSSIPTKIEADIYISIERIQANSIKLKTQFSDELHRVMIHGLLHLLGYDDKTNAEKEYMRKKENHYLALRPEF
jgi:rRNA maturation RNase YbeY